jgi:hypothetical protein
MHVSLPGFCRSSDVKMLSSYTATKSHNTLHRDHYSNRHILAIAIMIVVSDIVGITSSQNNSNVYSWVFLTLSVPVATVI